MFIARITDEEIIGRIKNKEFVSIQQIGRSLGLKRPDGGGFYSRIHKLVEKFGLDTSHWLGQRHNKNKIFGPKRDINDYLNNTFSIGSNALKKRLIKEQLKEQKCENCGLKYWLNNPIPLELHHIDGNRINNQLENLQLLCANCHTLTKNYRRRKQTAPTIQPKRCHVSEQELVNVIKNSYNKRESLLKLGLQPMGGNYARLDKTIEKYDLTFLAKQQQKQQQEPRNPNWRKQPRPHLRKVIRPSKEELEKLVWQKSTSQLARDFGVSDNAIGKWCKLYEISKPPRGYWSKKYIEEGKFDLQALIARNKSKVKPIVHNTASGYRKGCRCENCCSFYRNYRATQKRGRQEKLKNLLLLLIINRANLNKITLPL